MSTATATATDARAALAPRSLARPSLARLTLVELRKMTDTRAGFWLQLATVALTIVVVVVDCLFGHAQDQTLREMLSLAVAPASILLPIAGILLVTSEWSQRTAMVTFALVPRRPRVLAAKLLASVVLSLIALALCIVAAVIGTAVAAPAIDHAWALPVGLLGQHVVSLGTGMISGVALGAALLASAPAIVVSFAAPLVWAIAGRLAGLDTLGHWLDPTYSLAPLTEHIMDATEWARAGTTLALWMVLPLVIGLWRIQRGEIR